MRGNLMLVTIGAFNHKNWRKIVVHCSQGVFSHGSQKNTWTQMKSTKHFAVLFLQVEKQHQTKNSPKTATDCAQITNNTQRQPRVKVSEVYFHIHNLILAYWEPKWLSHTKSYSKGHISQLDRILILSLGCLCLDQKPWLTVCRSLEQGVNVGGTWSATFLKKLILWCHLLKQKTLWNNLSGQEKRSFVLIRVRVWRPWFHTPTQTSLKCPPPPPGLSHNTNHTKRFHPHKLICFNPNW